MGLRLLAELGLDGSGFESGMDKAEAAAHHLAEGIKGFVIGAIGIATLEQAISKTVETASELVETSKRLSIAPEQLQILRRAAKESGTELENLAGAFEKIDIARQKALNPSDPEGQKARRGFQALGIGQADLRSQTAAQLFMGQISSSARGRNSEEIVMALRDVMGKSFGELVPVMKTNFEELGNKMKEVGAIMDTETAVKLKLLSSELGMASTIFITMLAPAIVSFVELLLSLAGKIQAGFVWLENVLKKDQTGAGPMDRLLQWSQAYTARAWLEQDKEHPWMTDKDRAEAQATIKAYESSPSAMDAAAIAFDQTDEKWKAMIAAMQKTLAEETEKLNHPPAPDFSRPAEAAKMTRRALQISPDSLTRVGNFLGGMGNIQHIEQRKVQLLQQIANNTGKGGRPLGSPRGLGDFNQPSVRFPVG